MLRIGVTLSDIKRDKDSPSVSFLTLAAVTPGSSLGVVKLTEKANNFYVYLPLAHSNAKADSPPAILNSRPKTFGVASQLLDDNWISSVFQSINHRSYQLENYGGSTGEEVFYNVSDMDNNDRDNEDDDNDDYDDDYGVNDMDVVFVKDSFEDTILHFITYETVSNPEPTDHQEDEDREEEEEEGPSTVARSKSLGAWEDYAVSNVIKHMEKLDLESKEDDIKTMMFSPDTETTKQQQQQQQEKKESLPVDQIIKKLGPTVLGTIRVGQARVSIVDLFKVANQLNVARMEHGSGINDLLISGGGSESKSSTVKINIPLIDFTDEPIIRGQIILDCELIVDEIASNDSDVDGSSSRSSSTNNSSRLLDLSNMKLKENIDMKDTKLIRFVANKMESLYTLDLYLSLWKYSSNELLPKYFASYLRQFPEISLVTKTKAESEEKEEVVFNKKVVGNDINDVLNRDTLKQEEEAGDKSLKKSTQKRRPCDVLKYTFKEDTDEVIYDSGGGSTRLKASASSVLRKHQPIVSIDGDLKIPINYYYSRPIARGIINKEYTENYLVSIANIICAHNGVDPLEFARIINVALDNSHGELKDRIDLVDIERGVLSGVDEKIVCVSMKRTGDYETFFTNDEVTGKMITHHAEILEPVAKQPGIKLLACWRMFVQWLTHLNSTIKYRLDYYLGSRSSTGGSNKDDDDNNNVFDDDEVEMWDSFIKLREDTSRDIDMGLNSEDCDGFNKTTHTIIFIVLMGRKDLPNAHKASGDRMWKVWSDTMKYVNNLNDENKRREEEEGIADGDNSNSGLVNGLKRYSPIFEKMGGWDSPLLRAFQRLLMYYTPLSLIGSTAPTNREVLFEKQKADDSSTTSPNSPSSINPQPFFINIGDIDDIRKDDVIKCRLFDYDATEEENRFNMNLSSDTKTSSSSSSNPMKGGAPNQFTPGGNVHYNYLKEVRRLFLTTKELDKLNEKCNGSTTSTPAHSWSVLLPFKNVMLELLNCLIDEDQAGVKRSRYDEQTVKIVEFILDRLQVHFVKPDPNGSSSSSVGSENYSQLDYVSVLDLHPLHLEATTPTNAFCMVGASTWLKAGSPDYIALREIEAKNRRICNANKLPFRTFKELKLEHELSDEEVDKLKEQGEYNNKEEEGGGSADWMYRGKVELYNLIKSRSVLLNRKWFRRGVMYMDEGQLQWLRYNSPEMRTSLFYKMVSCAVIPFMDELTGTKDFTCAFTTSVVDDSNAELIKEPEFGVDVEYILGPRLRSTDPTYNLLITSHRIPPSIRRKMQHFGYLNKLWELPTQLCMYSKFNTQLPVKMEDLWAEPEYIQQSSSSMIRREEEEEDYDELHKRKLESLVQRNFERKSKTVARNANRTKTTSKLIHGKKNKKEKKKIHRLTVEEHVVNSHRRFEEGKMMRNGGSKSNIAVNYRLLEDSVPLQDVDSSSSNNEEPMISPRSMALNSRLHKFSIKTAVTPISPPPPLSPSLPPSPLTLPQPPVLKFDALAIFARNIIFVNNGIISPEHLAELEAELKQKTTKIRKSKSKLQPYGSYVTMYSFIPN